MSSHFRATLWLLGLTVLLCAVLYPLLLLGIGQTLFRDRAQGSLVTDEEGKVIGSRLLAQPFTADEYFWPRPSAASYNGASSGASNWGANNPRLRDRVARQLGPTVKYAGGPKAGQPVGPDIERWFPERPDRAAAWAKEYPTLAAAWVTSDDLYKTYVARWAEDHPEVLAAWREANPGKEHDPTKPEELAVAFFASFARPHPGSWPSLVEGKTPAGKSMKKVEPVKEGADLQAAFFDLWLQAHPRAELEKVPGDQVTASGSGLDPHITLRNARSQLDRVAAARAKQTGADPARVRSAIDAILNEHSFAPLGGLAGEPLVNVLEVNLALRGAMKNL